MALFTKWKNVSNETVETGKVYYLDATNGNDSWDGDKEKPWKTIAKAQAVATEGDTVFVYDGEYGEFAESTDRSMYLRYKAVSGESPVLTNIAINGSGTPTPIDSCLIFDGFTIEEGVTIPSASHLKFKNCDITIDGNYAISGVSSDYVTIENCELTQNSEIIYEYGVFWVSRNNTINGAKPAYGSTLNTLHDLADGLVYANLFNEGSGTTVRDLVSNNDFNLSTNPPTWVDEGLEFNSADTMPYIIGPVFNTILPSSSECTIMWGYDKTNSPFYHYFFTVGDTWTIFSMLWQPTDDAGHIFINSVEPTYLLNSFLEATTMALVIDNVGENSVSYIYKDGSQVATDECSQQLPNSTERLNIGGRTDNTPRHAGGIFKWFYIWDKILSADEIASIHSNPYQFINSIIETTMQSSVTKGGITWTFDTTYPVGQFVNGDYFVIGNVSITAITKPHSTNGKDGSMINPTIGNHGYNDLSSYTAGLDVSRSFPFTLQTGQSLVSTISWVDGDSGCPPLISNPAPEKPRPMNREAQILTCLASSPPIGTFRPAYSGTTKTLYNANDLQWDLLPSLDSITGTPTLAYYEKYFSGGVWLDHGTSYWFDEYLHPDVNFYVQDDEQQFGYGREIGWQTNDSILMMMLNSFTQSQKQTLMYYVIQFGIDSYWCAENGCYWMHNGGHGTGRKWPILFAGVMLNNTALKSVGSKSHTSSTWRFGEDEQTFYIAQADVDRHAGYTGMIGTAEWGIRHWAEPNNDDPTWIGGGDGYRQHTGSAWVGAALAVSLLDTQNPTLGVRDLWNWEAFFDYEDRYLNTEVGSYRSMTNFSENMWDEYR